MNCLDWMKLHQRTLPPCLSHLLHSNRRWFKWMKWHYWTKTKHKSLLMYSKLMCLDWMKSAITEDSTHSKSISSLINPELCSSSTFRLLLLLLLNKVAPENMYDISVTLDVNPTVRFEEQPRIPHSTNAGRKRYRRRHLQQHLMAWLKYLWHWMYSKRKCLD